MTNKKFVEKYKSQIDELYYHLNIKIDADYKNVMNDYERGYLDEWIERNGSEWLWYFDGQLEGAVAITSKKYLDAADIKETFHY